LISAIGVIGLSVSIIKENRDLTDQIISKSEE
jgi:hypothetical protein